jgi:hypothetical protein
LLACLPPLLLLAAAAAAAASTFYVFLRLFQTRTAEAPLQSTDHNPI